MKKQIFRGFLCLLVTIIGLFACSKEINKYDNPTTDVSKSSKFRPNTASLESILNLSTDREDRVINERLHYIEQYLIQNKYNQNKAFIKHVVDVAKKTGGAVSGDQIFDKYPELAPIFASKSPRQMVTGRNTCDVEYDGYCYSIGINVPNYEIADPYADPIFSGGLEVEDDPTTGNADMILSDYTDIFGNVTQVLVGSNDGAIATEPMLVMTLLEVTQNSGSLPPLPNLASNTVNLRNTWVKVKSLQINHRYDNSSYSEVAAAFGLTKNSSISGWTWNSEWNRTLRWIHKNDIGNLQTLVNADFCETFDPNIDRIYYNIYEWD